MCGIAGIYAFNEIGRIFLVNLSNATRALEHRGPDAQGLYDDYKIGLGHRRLSILDLSPDANQPFTDSSGRYTVIFNGEIYNYKELREELINRGYAFRTNCDTEVLLNLYIEEGESCLKKLNGFFSFSIYDKEEESLIVARDRYGIKPLVYYQDEDKLIFSSEITSLLGFNIPKEINYNALLFYFQLSYIPAPISIFKNVHKLQPGHYLKISAFNKEVQVKKYYEVKIEPSYFSVLRDYDSVKGKLLDLIENAVRDRLISDVPLGAFLSGGIDSSTVVALASRYTDHLNTFSISYKDEPMFDESKYASLVAKKYNTNHTRFELTNQDIFDNIFELLDFYGEPFADASAIPFYILSKRTRKKITVALSGDGADEVFAGYNKYLGEYKARERGIKAQVLAGLLPLWNVLPKNRNSFLGNKIRQFHRFSSGVKQSPQDRYWFLSTWRTEKETLKMFHNDILAKLEIDNYNELRKEFLSPIKTDDFNEFLKADIELLLPNDMLHKVDSMSMANSLEVRVPFLDHRVVDFAFTLSSKFKIDNKMKKKVLQDAVRDILPPELYKRPKHGFDVPLAKGYKRELKSWIQNDLLKDSFIEEQQIFKPEYIKNLKKKVFSSTNFDQNQVWAVLAFQYWWKKYF